VRGRLCGGCGDCGAAGVRLGLHLGCIYVGDLVRIATSLAPSRLSITTPPINASNQPIYQPTHQLMEPLCSVTGGCMYLYPSAEAASLPQDLVRWGCEAESCSGLLCLLCLLANWLAGLLACWLAGLLACWLSNARCPHLTNRACLTPSLLALQCAMPAPDKQSVSHTLPPPPAHPHPQHPQPGASPPHAPLAACCASAPPPPTAPAAATALPSRTPSLRPSTTSPAQTKEPRSCSTSKM